MCPNQESICTKIYPSEYTTGHRKRFEAAASAAAASSSIECRASQHPAHEISRNGWNIIRAQCISRTHALDYMRAPSSIVRVYTRCVLANAKEPNRQAAGAPQSHTAHSTHNTAFTQTRRREFYPTNFRQKRNISPFSVLAQNSTAQHRTAQPKAGRSAER